MKVAIFRMLGLLLGLLIGLATAKEDKLTCESCKVNMRDFTLKFCEVYETYKAKEFGNGDEDDHLCTGMIEKMEEDTKEKKLPNYYENMCAALDFCPLPNGFPPIPGTGDECLDCEEKFKNYLGLLCGLHEKYVSETNYDYQHVGECLNMVKSVVLKNIAPVCAAIGKCEI